MHVQITMNFVSGENLGKATVHWGSSFTRLASRPSSLSSVALADSVADSEWNITSQKSTKWGGIFQKDFSKNSTIAFIHCQQYSSIFLVLFLWGIFSGLKSNGWYWNVSPMWQTTLSMSANFGPLKCSQSMCLIIFTMIFFRLLIILDRIRKHSMFLHGYSWLIERLSSELFRHYSELQLQQLIEKKEKKNA